MLKVSTKGLRVVGILAMALVIAHCGDSDVRVSTGPGVVPSPGTFNGTLSDGGTIRIEVGSIEEVEFTCDGEQIQETFSPPQDIENDGTFSVGFSDGGREFRIRGTFRDNNNVDGTVDDEDNECDVSYDANRGDVLPTPVRTPTPGGEATSTPGVGPTSTAGGGPTSTPGGPTSTAGGPTFTPGGGVLTPTATPTSAPNTCPVAVKVEGNGGTAKVLDSGWTGLAHNATVVSDGTLTFTLDCTPETRPCGVCNVSGPIQNLEADEGVINARRCNNDTSIKCTDNSACGSGQCLFFFGAPLPLSAGGISTCVTNQVNGSVSGTANIESGAFASTLNLTSRVYNQITVDQPCPTCNDATLNDGVQGGTCNGGVRSGQPCDANGTSPVETFGTTSLDCPPQGLISALSIALDGSSGDETLALSASSPNCRGVGAQSQKCFCDAGGSGESTRPNACLDDSTTPLPDVEGCVPVSSGSNKGQCEAGPIDRVCSPLETFRSCLQTSECNGSDTCVPVNRPCFLDNGVVGGQVVAQGEADPPSNGVSNPTFASLFCIPPVAQPAVNAAGGLPGLGRLELPLISTEILTLPAP
jgi:hypothetical protein